jgi:amino acid transporter
MSTRGELPKVLSAVHAKFRTPHIAIIVTGTFMLALTLSSSLIYALTVSTIARLLAYAATCVALPTLRRQRDCPPAQFIVPGGTVISVVAVLLSIWLLSNSTYTEARDAGIAVGVGVAIYFFYRKVSQR